MWAFKQLWDKGLVYEGFRVVPYSWAAQTPLSQFRDAARQFLPHAPGPGADRRLPARPEPARRSRRSCSPGRRRRGRCRRTWRSRSSPDADYAVLEKGGERLDPRRGLARALRGGARRLRARSARIKGSRADRAHLRAALPVLRRHARRRRLPRRSAASSSRLGEGTGVVHMAPAFGEDDMASAQAAGMPVVDPVDFEGNFTDEVPPYAGQERLRGQQGHHPRPQGRAASVVRHETYDHNYPHCWRTDQPLIYKAMPSWYVKVTAFRDRMVELNQGITWVPEHVTRRHLRQLAGQRARLEHRPQPLLGRADPGVEVGRPGLSAHRRLRLARRDRARFRRAAEGPAPALCRRADAARTRTTRPASRRCAASRTCSTAGSSRARCRSPRCTTRSRTRSGSTSHFPGDFIVEYVGQTRGWFYTLMVLATALFDKAPFRNCICHGVVLDENKQKLSKRLKNYPDPVEVFNTYGADALRWYMVSSPLLSGGDLAMPKDGRAIGEAVRAGAAADLERLFVLHALRQHRRHQAASWSRRPRRSSTATSSARRRSWCARVEGGDGPARPRRRPATRCRRSSRRSTTGTSAARATASGRRRRTPTSARPTTRSTRCWSRLTRTMAPFLPYLTEHIHRALGDGESVHLQDWPDASAFAVDAALVERMDLAREVCSAAASIRTAKNLRNRLPLRELTVAHPRPRDPRAAPRRHRRGGERQGGRLRRRSVAVRLRGAGRQSAHRRQAARPRDEGRARRGQGRRRGSGSPDGAVEVAGQRIEPDEYELRFQAQEGLDATSFDGNAGVVVLDTKVDAGTGARGPRPRLHPPGPGGAEGRRLQRRRPHPHRGQGRAGGERRHRRPSRRGQARDARGLARARPTACRAGFVSEAKLGDEPIAIGVRVAG